MKKVVSVLLAMVLVWTLAGAGAETARYEDAQTGVSFMPPDGWTEVENTSGNDNVRAIYMVPGYNGMVIIQYAMMDFYTLSNMSGTGKAREDVDFGSLTEDMVKMMFSPAEVTALERKEIGGNEFYMARCMIDGSMIAAGISVDTESAVTMKNGYVIMFQYIVSEKFDEFLPVFEGVLETVEIK